MCVIVESPMKSGGEVYTIYRMYKFNLVFFWSLNISTVVYSKRYLSRGPLKFVSVPALVEMQHAF